MESALSKLFEQLKTGNSAETKLLFADLVKQIEADRITETSAWLDAILNPKIAAGADGNVTLPASALQEILDAARHVELMLRPAMSLLAKERRREPTPNILEIEHRFRKTNDASQTLMGTLRANLSFVEPPPSLVLASDTPCCARVVEYDGAAPAMLATIWPHVALTATICPQVALTATCDLPPADEEDLYA
jgi:hypothetical protein